VVVVVSRLDRLGRRVLERVRCREELKALGVAVHSVREGGEVSDLVANVLAAVAEEELNLISDRTKAAWEFIAASGWFKPGPCPFGYRWRARTDGERQRGAPEIVLEPDPLAAPYVRDAFRRVSDGESARSVARSLARLPAEVRGDRSKRGGVRQMPWRSIQRMLRSAVYVGRLTPDGSFGQWEPLVDEATWQAVQARLDGHHRQPRQASLRYLLAGILRCPACGTRMHGQATPKLPAVADDRAASILRYRCGSGSHYATRCHQTVDARKANALVLAEVDALLGAFADTARPYLDHAWRALARPAGAPLGARQVARLEQKITTAKQRIVAATERLVDGAIPQDAYDGLCAKARADIDEAAAELDRLHTQQVSTPALPPLAEVLRRVARWRAVLDTADVAAQRDVLLALVEQVVARRVRHGRYVVKITWTPLGQELRRLTGADALDARQSAA
jgi:hypothetical protein